LDRSQQFVIGADQVQPAAGEAFEQFEFFDVAQRQRPRRPGGVAVAQREVRLGKNEMAIAQNQPALAEALLPIEIAQSINPNRLIWPGFLECFAQGRGQFIGLLKKSM
jgi:hypothetical protein